MTQNLSKKELNDVAEVMLYTKMHQSKHRLLKMENLKYAIAMGFIFYFGFSTTLASSEIVAKFALLLSLFSFGLAAYIFFFNRGLRKNVRKMIERRIGVPIDVTITKSYIRYNGTNISWDKIEKIIEYKDLYYCVFGQNFIVIKANSELNKVIDVQKSSKYVRYNQLFTLF